MPLWGASQTGFIVLEDAAESLNDNFLVFNGTDANGVNDSGDRVQFSTDASEAKPKFLTEAADGSGEYSKENTYATKSGWVRAAGTGANGNDNASADPEVLVCVRNLQKRLGEPTAQQITIGNLTDKTKYYPDGDTFTGVASSSLGDVTAYVYYNEPIQVTGTPQLQLKQASALGSTFGTIMDFREASSDLRRGVIAFALPASTDTRTSNVTNNTLGINSDDAISLNSGLITQMNGDRVLEEIGNVSDGGTLESIEVNSSTSGGQTTTGGDLLLEDTTAVNLTIAASADASFTVS